MYTPSIHPIRLIINHSTHLSDQIIYQPLYPSILLHHLSTTISIHPIRLFINNYIYSNRPSDKIIYQALYPSILIDFYLPLYQSILLDYISTTLSIHPTRLFINHFIYPSYQYIYQQLGILYSSFRQYYLSSTVSIQPNRLFIYHYINRSYQIIYLPLYVSILQDYL